MKEDHRTPEQIKIAMAKKLIQKTKNNINKKEKQNQSKGHDDFFIVEENDIGIKKN